MPASQIARLKMPSAPCIGNNELRRCIMDTLSCAALPRTNCVQKRQNHATHEQWVKEDESRRAGKNPGKQPPAKSETKGKPFPQRAALEENSQTLQHKIAGWQAIAAARGERDHQVVDHS